MGPQGAIDPTAQIMGHTRRRPGISSILFFRNCPLSYLQIMKRRCLGLCLGQNYCWTNTNVLCGCSAPRWSFMPPRLVNCVSKRRKKLWVLV